MLWLFVVIFAYFLLAINALIDRHLLSGPIPGPRIYACFIGLLSSIALLLFIPFGFSIPSLNIILISIFAGILFVFALLSLYSAFQKFEASRIIPSVGAIMPLFTLAITYLFFREEISFGFWEVISFIFLILGSILISFDKKTSITLNSLKISIIIAFLFSLYFILSKIVYIDQGFVSGFVWMRIGVFLTGISFLLFPDVRQEIFKKRKSFKLKTMKLFLLNQSMGASATLLQSWAIALAPFGCLAFINALAGTKYIFLLCLAVLFAWKIPYFVREKMTKKILFQKIMAVALISLGLIIFTF